MSLSTTIVKSQEIKACATRGCSSLRELKKFHAFILRHAQEGNSYLLYMLIRTCNENGWMRYARSLFAMVSEPNVFLWNGMIRGYVCHGFMEEAIGMYGSMARSWSLQPNNRTFPFVLKACGSVLDVCSGKMIHTQVLKMGLQFDVFVGTSLVSMYGRFGDLGMARQAFVEMPHTNAVAWTAMIGAYERQGRFSEAIDLFQESLANNVELDSFILVCVLSACSQLGDAKIGQLIHDSVKEMGLENNVFVTTALVDMYCKCGSLNEARKVFDRMRERDVVSWSALICGYCQNNHPNKALQLFSLMQQENVKPDSFTMVGVLSACAQLGALALGERVYTMINKDELSRNPVLGTALIDMYLKRESPNQAWDVFELMKKRDIITWNSIMWTCNELLCKSGT